MLGPWRDTVWLIRDLTEYGRSLELPAWHGTERRHACVWYSCLQHLRLVEVEAGQALAVEGQRGDCCYWLLAGEGGSSRACRVWACMRMCVCACVHVCACVLEQLKGASRAHKSLPRLRGRSPCVGPNAVVPCALFPPTLDASRWPGSVEVSGTGPAAAARQLAVFDRFGQEALEGVAYASTATVGGGCMGQVRG